MSVVDQVARLAEAGVARAAGITRSELAGHAAALPEVPGAIVAIHPALAPPSRLAGLLRYEGRAGFVVEDMTDLDEFAPIDALAIPDLPLYLVHDPTRGDGLRNCTPVEALAAIRERELREAAVRLGLAEDAVEYGVIDQVIASRKAATVG